MNNNFPPIIDASGPGVLDLGEIIIFSLGNDAYIVSLPTSYKQWEEIGVYGPLRRVFPGARMMVVYRPDGDTPSYTDLAENADLRQMVEEMVVEALKKVMKP